MFETFRVQKYQRRLTVTSGLLQRYIYLLQPRSPIHPLRTNRPLTVRTPSLLLVSKKPTRPVKTKVRLPNYLSQVVASKKPVSFSGCIYDYFMMISRSIGEYGSMNTPYSGDHPHTHVVFPFSLTRRLLLTARNSTYHPTC